MAEYAAMEAQRELIARQVLEDAGGGRLRFLHAKLRETAYEGIPAARRRALHGRTGRAIEARLAGSDALPLRYAELASHFVPAGEVLAALQYLELAGEQALGNFANQEAIGFFGDLLALDARSPATLAERETTCRAGSGAPAGSADSARPTGPLGDLDAMREHASLRPPPHGPRGPAIERGLGPPPPVEHPRAGRAPDRPPGLRGRGAERRELLREAAASMEPPLGALLLPRRRGDGRRCSLCAVNLAERAGGDVRAAMPLRDARAHGGGRQARGALAAVLRAGGVGGGRHLRRPRHRPRPRHAGHAAERRGRLGARRARPFQRALDAARRRERSERHPDHRDHPRQRRPPSTGRFVGRPSASSWTWPRPRAPAPTSSTWPGASTAPPAR